MQRFFDITFASLAVLALLPIFFIFSIILRFTGEGEVFYIQDRVGKDGRIFGLYKFATMLKNSPNIGSKEITLKNDPRVLPFGRFLRKSKINELPQLFNIIFGDMSIVGPRPMVPNTFKRYPALSQQKLTSVRPGLTGIGSIIFRNEEDYLNNRKDPEKFYINEIIPYKSEIESWYIDNNSLVNYFKCIFVTAYIVIFSNNKSLSIKND